MKFDSFASKSGGRSKTLRRMIEAVTGSEPSVEAAPRGHSEKVTIRLKSVDLARLDEQAGDAGMRRTEWIAARVREALHARPQFSREERLALVNAHREIRKIGVNINQIAHAMNVAVMPGSSVLDNEIAAVKDCHTDIMEIGRRLLKVAAGRADAVKGRGGENG
ncbi:plasmid mobilization relaxosome protein MobC [Inquilinus sp. NPDC058860]|uniref:plasmid mobilization relaxosome protein MobC n=1 Tax=Inquilinus sp. NPDC058860 TaxID=3346652 RepID=UPI0036A71219